MIYFFFFQAEDGIRDVAVTGVRRVLFRSGGRRHLATAGRDVAKLLCHRSNSQRFLPNYFRPDKVTGVATNTLTDIRNIRLKKAETLRSLGLNPYPSRSKRTHYTKAILDDFANHENQQVT